MAAKTPGPVIDSAFAPVVKAFARRKEVTVAQGWGAGNTVLKVRGKIFAMAVRGDLVVKLPKARVAELVAARVGTRFDPRGDGRVMKEWLVVAKGAHDWVALAKEALGFVATG